MAPDLFHKCQKNCVNPLKSLRLSNFPFDGLITPTPKAAGSNPVGHTKTAESNCFRRSSFTNLKFPAEEKERGVGF